MRIRLIALLLAICSYTAQAQSPDALTSVVGPAPNDRAISPGSGIEVQATTDASNASIKVSSVATGRFFTTWQGVASAPLSKTENQTNVAAAQGFPDSFVFTAKYSGYNLAAALSAPDLTSASAKETIDQVCADVKAKAKGMSDDDLKKLKCSEDSMDLGVVGKYAPQDLSRAQALFFDPSKPDTMWGATGTVGYRSFQYLQTSGGKLKANRTPVGGSLFLGIIPPHTLTLFTGGAEYRRKYKESDSGAICPPASVQCKTGPVGAPTRNDQKLAYFEVRRLMSNHAVSLKTAYDFASHHWSGDLPIYLIKTPTGALAGGVRASWEQTKGAQFGVFVSSAFSLFPF